MAWTPDPQGLERMLNILRLSQSGNTETQRQVALVCPSKV